MYAIRSYYDFVMVTVDKGLTQGDILNIIHESDSAALIFSGSLAEIFKDKIDVLVKVKFYINMDSEKKENDVFSMSYNFV